MKKIHEKIKKVLDSKISVSILYAVGIALTAMLIFYGGVAVGFHKASFGRAWGDHYNENFGMGPRGPGNMGMMGYLPNAHGTVGKIIKMELPTVIVQDKDNTEKVVLIKDDTRIQKMREQIVTTDLKIDDFIVVVGSPNEQGQIEAKLIRVMPSPDFLNQPK
ncbi:MAG: hypothetical protein PHS95_02620 [Candidatus Pacebacteria bacterium]|nr:hypothetical protein [Candidatus Paceibacterota bacterium]